MMRRVVAVAVLLVSAACTTQDDDVTGNVDVEENVDAASLQYSGTGLVLGQLQTGELLDTHPQMNDGTHANCYQLETREGQHYSITLRSEDFDSYLLVGVGFCQDVMLQYENDDFEEGSLDARVVFAADYPFYSVYVNTFEPGVTGNYSLLAEVVEPGA
jgi:hypothetical protein